MACPQWCMNLTPIDEHGESQIAGLFSIFLAIVARGDGTVWSLICTLAFLAALIFFNQAKGKFIIKSQDTHFL